VSSIGPAPSEGDAGSVALGDGESVADVSGGVVGSEAAGVAGSSACVSDDLVPHPPTASAMTRVTWGSR